MDTLSLLFELPTTPEEAKKFETMMLNDIDCGNHNPLEILKVLKLNIDLLTKVVKNDHFLHIVDKELEKYPNSKAEVYGSKFSIVYKKTFDFKQCQDSKWNDLKIRLDSVKEEIKGREAFLKHLSEPMADPESGEVINPPEFTNSCYTKVEKSK